MALLFFGDQSISGLTQGKYYFSSRSTVAHTTVQRFNLKVACPLSHPIGRNRALNLCATHDVESDVGNQVQEKYADLEDRHPGVVKHVELLD